MHRKTLTKNDPEFEGFRSSHYLDNRRDEKHVIRLLANAGKRGVSIC